MRATITIDIDSKEELLWFAGILAAHDVPVKTILPEEESDEPTGPVDRREYYREFYSVYDAKELEAILRRQGRSAPDGISVEKLRKMVMSTIPPALHLSTLTVKRLREELRRRSIKPNKATTKSALTERLIGVVCGEEKK